MSARKASSAMSRRELLAMIGSVAGRYPALASNPKLASREYPMMLVVNGSRAMPSFAQVLKPDEIAAAVNYVRTHFGNHYPDVLTTAEVKAVLPRQDDRDERH